MKKIKLTQGKCLDCGGRVLKKSQKPCKRCSLCLEKRRKELSKIHQLKYRSENIEKVKKSAREYARRNRKLYPKENHIKDRKLALMKNYGITVKEYGDLFEKQNGLCLICRKPEIVSKYLCVDHNHDDGEIRGLLCRKCNLALGYVGDDIAILKRMINYLKK